MKNLGTILVCLAITSCVADTAGVGTYTPPDTTGGDVPRGDAFPAGAVSYFRKVSCPDDWEPYEAATGRVMISASDELPRGTLIGEALTSGEDREHGHTITASVEVPVTEIAGIEGGGNDGMTPAGSYALDVGLTSASAGLPYVQLLACKKMVEPGAGALPLPAKLQTYFDLDACPDGWKKAETGAGRIVVGLQPEAPADKAFGGEPITSATAREHTHSFESTLTTEPHGVALVSGCCGKFGKNGAYAISGQTESIPVDVPMIALTHCEKQ